MLEVIKVIVSLVVIIPIISKLFDIINYNDLDIALSSRSEQQINRILNIIQLFVLNVIIILFGALIFYSKWIPSPKWIDFVNTIEIIILIIIVLVYVFIKPKEGYKLCFFQKSNCKIAIGIITLLLNCISAIIYILVYAPPTNLFWNNAILVIMIAGIFSIYTIQLLGIMNNRPKESKFYYELDKGEKYYIHYVQKDNFVVCSTEKVFDKARKYKCVPLEELKRTKEIVREEIR